MGAVSLGSSAESFGLGVTLRRWTAPWPRPPADPTPPLPAGKTL